MKPTTTTTTTVDTTPSKAIGLPVLMTVDKVADPLPRPQPDGPRTIADRGGPAQHPPHGDARSQLDRALGQAVVTRPELVEPPRLLTIKAAAATLGISAWTVRDLIASGTLRAVQPPGLRRIWLDRRDIEKAIQEWKS